MVGREFTGETDPVLFGDTERRLPSPLLAGLGGSTGLGDSK